MLHDGAQASEQQDTSPKAMERYRQRIRETPPRERLRRALFLSNRVREATMSDVERSMPGASRNEIAVAFVRRLYGERLALRLAARLQAP